MCIRDRLESVDEFCERYFTEDVVKKMYEDHGMPQEIAEMCIRDRFAR